MYYLVQNNSENEIQNKMHSVFYKTPCEQNLKIAEVFISDNIQETVFSFYSPIVSLKQMKEISFLVELEIENNKKVATH